MKIFLWPLSRASKRMVVMQSRALHGVANFGRGQWLRVELLATTNHDYYVNINFKHLNSEVSWCSWLSRQSNTLKVSGSSPGEANIFSYFFPLRKNYLPIRAWNSHSATETKNKNLFSPIYFGETRMPFPQCSNPACTYRLLGPVNSKR